MDDNDVFNYLVNEITLLVQQDPNKVGEHWTQDGKPTVDYLEQRIGMNISASERDEAFAEYLKQVEQAEAQEADARVEEPPVRTTAEEPLAADADDATDPAYTPREIPRNSSRPGKPSPGTPRG